MSNPFNSVTPCTHLWDSWEHRVFVSTNETDERGQVFQKIRTEKICGNTIMGVSGFFTLDIAAARGEQVSVESRQIEHIILFDCSIRVFDFWKEMRRAIISSKDRTSLIDTIISIINKKKDFYFKFDSTNYGERICKKMPGVALVGEVEDLRSRIREGKSWLSNDARYKKIKELFSTGNVSFLPLDLTEPQGFLHLNEIFAIKKIRLDALYISNIREYSGEENQLIGCERSLDAIVTEETLVIDTVPRRSEEHTLTQRIHRLSGAPVRCLLSGGMHWNISKGKKPALSHIPFCTVPDIEEVDLTRFKTG